MVDIVIWRHAQAEIQSESTIDSARALTRKGREDAHLMAKWLDKFLPLGTKIYCSPALRCVQTVEALTKLNQKKSQRDVLIVDALGIESNANRIRQECIYTEATTILLVGHQPVLGELIADLLHGHHEENRTLMPSVLLPKILTTSKNYAIKKGAVWWLRQQYPAKLIAPKDAEVSADFYVLNVQHPKFLA